MKKLFITSLLGTALFVAPLQTFANLGDQTLRPTMTHSDVKTMQALLREKGYFTYSGSTTSYYGSYTKKLSACKGPDSGWDCRPQYV
jgi:peptidoglycan DL-endopeptidase LytE